MKKVRYVRIVVRTLQCVLYILLLRYAFFCSTFVFFQGNELDYRYISYFFLPLPFILYKEIQEFRDTSSLLVRFNRWLVGENVHARYPTDTERNIIKSFFDEKKLEMPILFTVNFSDAVNAYACHYHGKNIILFTEQAYRKCTPRELSVAIAHEQGHLQNGDMFFNTIENTLSLLSQWLSVLIICKISGYFLFIFPADLHYSGLACLFIAYLSVLFLTVVKVEIQKVFSLTKEVLADNTAAQFLGTSVPVKEFLHKFMSKEMIHFSERQFALSWVCKKKV